MKNRLFHKGLFFEYLRQLKTIFSVWLILFVLQSILIPLGYALSYRNAEYRSEPEIGMDIVYVLLIVAAIMPICMDKLMSYLRSRKASDFYHTLPVRRETMYLTALLSVFAYGVLLIVIPILTGILSCLIFGITQHFYFRFCVSILAVGVFLSSITALSRSLSGTRINAMLISLMILAVPRIIQLIFYKLIQQEVQVFVLVHNEWSLFNPCNNFFVQLVMVSGNVADWCFSSSCLMWTVLTAILYFAAAGIILKYRKSEKAENPVIHPVLQRAFQIIPAAMLSLFPVYMTIELVHSSGRLRADGYFSYFVMYLLILIVYVLYELITTRKIRLNRRFFMGLGIIAVWNLASFLGIRLMGSLVRSDVPDADEISSVEILNEEQVASRAPYFSSWKQNELEDIIANGKMYTEELQKLSFESEGVRSAVSETLRKSIEDQLADEHYVEIDYDENGVYYDRYTYNLYYVKIDTKGKTIYRKLRVHETDGFINAVREEIKADKEFLKAYHTLPQTGNERVEIWYANNYSRIFNYNFNDRQDIYLAICDDVAEFTDEEWFAYINEERSGKEDLLISFDRRNSASFDLRMGLSELPHLLERAPELISLVSNNNWYE